MEPGIAFEKLVAAIQTQIDPSAVVAHDEIIVDRLGHSRQFDVVVRGRFAGQEMLGVIECKDLMRRVGTPEVDAFVTKAQDINANFKVLMSRKGFSRPALEKCAHYGVQALSLVNADPANKKFFLGMRWIADQWRWGQVSIRVHFAQAQSVVFKPEEVKIRGKKVLDWFTNHLLENKANVKELGWVVDSTVRFKEPQLVTFAVGCEHVCTAIEFAAERICDKFERSVGISGSGFFNWNTKQATFTPGTIVTDSVPMDFSQWQRRRSDESEPAFIGLLEVRLETSLKQFERSDDAIELHKL